MLAAAMVYRCLGLSGTLVASLAMMIQAGEEAENSGQSVTVAIEQRSHAIITQPMRETSPHAHFDPAVSTELKRLRKAMKGIEKKIRQQLQEEHQGLYDEAAAAKRSGSLSGRDRSRVVIGGLERQARSADEEWSELHQQVLALQQAAKQRESLNFTAITLKNSWLEVIVTPELGMRILNAVDLKTGQSLAGTPDPRQYEKDDFEQHSIWTAGYIEHSFPYFEHGMFVRQPAGWRVVTHDDGSVTVAMTMFFTHWQHPRHQARHGNFSDRNLSVLVTLQPDSRSYQVVTRVDNPNPLPRSERLWTNHHLHSEGYDDQHLIFPAGHVSTHSVWWTKPYRIEPFFAEGGQTWYSNVSLFAIYSEYGFSGLYSSKNDFNSLIIKDSTTVPGLKLYTGERGFFEVWTGTTTLFEDPGAAVAPYVPVSYQHDYYVADGIGRVQYATADFALGQFDTDDADMATFAVTSPKQTSVTVRDRLGQHVFEAVVGPNLPPLTWEVPRSTRYNWLVSVAGAPPATVTLPLPFAERQHLLAGIDQKGGERRVALEEISNTRFEMRVQDAINQADEILAEERQATQRELLAIAQACYRVGHFSRSTAILDLISRQDLLGDVDYLRALMQLEQGDEIVDFASAGADSFYLRAVQAHRQGNTSDALAWLDRLLELRSTALRPALLRAWLRRDLAAAQELHAENPASVDAAYVAGALGDDVAATAAATLQQNNPDAARHLQQFITVLRHGKWQHLPRYQPVLPQ